MSDEAKKIDDGGPAFPFEGGNRFEPRPGMSLRDYFAAKAMVGLSSRADLTDETIASWSYHVADAMLKARK